MSTTSLVRAPPANSLTNTARSVTKATSSLVREPSRTVSEAAKSSPIAFASSLLPKFSLTQRSSSPATPARQQPEADRTYVGTPGKWEHPRMDEIIRRQNANAFDSDNVRVALLNVALMATSFAVPYLLSTFLLLRSWLLSSSSSYSTYSTYTLYLIRGFLTLNLLLALHPLFRPTDACEDIPLTPAQRQLLGLPPMSRPATPQEQQQYVTPPRYSRSATPTGSSSSASSLRAAAAPLTSGSPLSGRGSASGSPSMFATVGGRESQIINSGGERRRLSYNSTGRSSPLSLSEFESAGSIGTPTKSGKASVALNSKWLYEKGRGSPRASPRASGSSFA